MTKEQFIERHRHELGGMICDAALANKSGAELSILLRSSLRKVDSLLALMWEELNRGSEGTGRNGATDAHVAKVVLPNEKPANAGGIKGR